MKQPIIPYGKQYITDSDIEAVTAILRSDFLTQGPAVADFETAFAQYTGSLYAVAVSNGTAALHLSCMALGISENDKVITTPITFAASANCARYCGAEVVFADIDPETYLIDLQVTESALQQQPAGSVKALIVVDFAGRAVNLQAFRELANRYGCFIIEDACHAPGGFFTDSTGTEQLCGNGTFADLSVFSFHPVKHIACGEGGMITTNNKALYEQLLQLRAHGITRDPQQFSNPQELAFGTTGKENYPAWYMEMHELGYNYRLTDIQAALGNSQLLRADTGLERRRVIARRYSEAFSAAPYIKGHSGAVTGHAYHLYVIETDDRAGLYQHLRENGVFAQIHYFPCHLMPYYRQFGWKPGDFPNAENYYNRCLSLPMYPTLSDEEQELVIDLVNNYFRS